MSEPTPEGVTPEFRVPDQFDPPRRPPALVWVASGVLMFFAVISVLGAFAAFALVQRGVAMATWLGAVTLGFAAIYVAVSVFLFRGKAWARRTGIAVAGVNIALSLLFSVTEGVAPNCIGLLLQVGIVVLLMRPEVANWCYPH